MKLSTVLTIVSAAIASSRTVSVPDGTDDDVRDPSIADGATWPGEKIPGQNSFNLCKGDRSYDAVCIESYLSEFHHLPRKRLEPTRSCCFVSQHERC